MSESEATNPAEPTERTNGTKGLPPARPLGAMPTNVHFFPEAPWLPRGITDLDMYVDTYHGDRVADGTHDTTLAHAMALISGWNYANPHIAAHQLRYHDVNANLTPIDASNPAMLLVSTAHFLRWKRGSLGVLSFRGTVPTSMINWLTDTDSLMRKFPTLTGRIHRGFYSNTEVVWNDISRVLQAAAANVPMPADLRKNTLPQDAPDVYDEPLTSLYITGHSLGAAMAIVAAASLVFGPDPAPLPSPIRGQCDGYRSWNDVLRGVYTYGTPMVGDATFAEACKPYFGHKLFRHVFNRDVVPRMPPATTGDYVHFGHRLYSPSTSDHWELQEATDRAANVFEAVASVGISFLARRVNYGHLISRALPLRYSLDDHMPTNYIDVSRRSLIL